MPDNHEVFYTIVLQTNRHGDAAGTVTTGVGFPDATTPFYMIGSTTTRINYDLPSGVIDIDISDDGDVVFDFGTGLRGFTGDLIDLPRNPWEISVRQFRSLSTSGDQALFAGRFPDGEPVDLLFSQIAIQPVPEPTPGVLSVIGLSALAAIARLRKKRLLGQGDIPPEA